jgi:cob(I)alamin adenosyltransferase
MKIYTKSGDEGTTGLYGSDRVSKGSWRIEAIGSIDELNSCLGLATVCAESQILTAIIDIQSRLFDIGAELATTPEGKFQFLSVSESDTEELEWMIDKWEPELEPLKNFVLPGGAEASARLHVARSVCRRCERILWRLAEEAEVRREIMVYLNRLSDWLFVAARISNFRQGLMDQPWLKKEKAAVT